jgi:putative ABC transport system permease protein
VPGTARFAWRAVLAAPAMTIALAATGLVVTAALVLGPTLMTQSATAALRYDLAAAGAARLDVATEGIQGVDAGPVPQDAGDGSTGTPDRSPADSSTPRSDEVQAVWGTLDSSLRSLRAAQPEPLAGALGAPGEALVFDALAVAPLVEGTPLRDSQLSLALDPDLTRDVTMVSGELPGPALAREPVPIALSTAVATEMGWPVGEQRMLPALGGSPILVELSGIFEATHADAPVWTHIVETLDPALIARSDGGTYARGTALVDPASLERLSLVGPASRTLAWFPVSIDRLEAPEAELLAQQTRAFFSTPRELPGGNDPRYAFGGELPALLDDTVAAQRETDAFVWTALAGPALGGAVVLGLLLTLLVRSRQDALRLLEARGASTPRRRLVLGAEAALAVTAGGVLGAVLALGTSWWITGGVILAPWAAATAVALVAVVAAGAALGHRPALFRRRPSQDSGATAGSTAGSSAAATVRLVGEAVLVLLTAATVLALVQRVTVPAVPVLAPVLLALTAGVLAARALPALLGVVRRRARRAPGAIRMLGSSRSSGAHGAPVVIGVASALALTLFSGALLTTSRAAVVDGSVAEVGADLALRGPGLTADVVDRIAETPGIDALAAVVVDLPVTVTVGAGSSREKLRLVVTDTAALERVQAGEPGSTPVPDGLTTARSDGSIPVVVSDSAAEAVGGEELSLRGHTLEIVGTAPDRSALTTAGTWMLVDSALASDVIGVSGTADVVLAGLDGSRPDAEVRASLKALLGDGVTIESPSAEAERAFASPRTAAEQTALVSAVVGGVAAAACAVLLAALAAASARRRRESVLAALGARRRQLFALAVWAAAPAVIVGTAAGLVAGLVLPWSIIPLLGLPSLEGALAAVVHVDPALSILTVAAFLIAAASAVLVTASQKGTPR